MADSLEIVGAQFGENLRAARKQAGMSQEHLGWYAALHRTEIGLLERGDRVPRIDTLIKLAVALSVPPGSLLEGIGFELETDSRGPKPPNGVFTALADGG